jgi:glycine dehydrogenase subunit 1
MVYGPHTADDRERMLAVLGIDSVERLFEDIPPAVRAAGLDLPGPLSELEVARELARLAARDRTDLVSFLGAGMYRHHIPAAVDTIVSRGEFATAYTPYQPEISQGSLQAVYEFQSLISELTGLPVVSASHYDGASATAEAALMTVRATGRQRVLISRAVHRHAVETARTYFAPGDRILEELPTDAGGNTDLAALEAALADPERPVAGVILGQPNAFGLVEPMARAAQLTHAAGALFVAVVEPVSLAVLAPPGEYGADIATGEGQPLGIAPQFGGPSLGLLAASQALLRQVPGRLVGRTTDADGRRAFVMTLRAREQDIRRDKAASNICTNQALCALAATTYLATVGPHGLVDVAAGGAAAAHRLEAALAEVGVLRLHASTAYLNEFAVSVPDAVGVHARLLQAGILAGLPLARWFPDDAALADALLLCATELTTDEDIARLAAALPAALAEGAGQGSAA